MFVPLSVDEVYRNLRATYKSIDLRVAAVRDGANWRNGLAVVRLRSEEPRTVERRLKELEQSSGRVDTPSFSIRLVARPISEWKMLLRGSRAGVLNVGGFEVELAEPLKLEGLIGHVGSGYNDLYPPREWKWRWPFVRVAAGQNSALITDSEHLSRAVFPLGYSSAREAVESLCQVSLGSVPQHGFHLYLPIFSMISDMLVPRHLGSLYVFVARHKKAPDTRLCAYVGSRESRLTVTPPEKIPLELEYKRALPPYEITMASCGVKALENTSEIEARLVSPNLGELHSYRGIAKQFFPTDDRNPLYSALCRFCSYTELERLVTRPHEDQPRALRAQGKFEQHISWLLNCLGLTAVVLGQYERLKARKTNVELGSVDILAYHSRAHLLLLVGCTLGRPKEEDLSNLLNVAAVLRNEAFKEGSCQVRALLVTGTEDSPKYWKPSGSNGDTIPILNQQSLKQILKLIVEDREEDFLELLRQSPWPSIVLRH